MLLSCLTLALSAQRVTLNYRKQQLDIIFSSITKQTGLSLAYSPELVNLKETASISAKSEELEPVLERLLSNTNIGHKVKDKSIFLFIKSEEPASKGKKKDKVFKKVVKGIVTDEKGEPIMGANVTIKGTNDRTITDVEGEYTLDVPENATIHVSFIGCISVDVKVSNIMANIALKNDSEVLDEVVVVGYGMQKKANLTGAVDQISSKAFENRSVSNVTQALQGVIPNLNITLTDGKPSRTASYNIRGNTSIGQGGSALVLIDGVEGDPAMLNPNDIESVSILKDASSAAIYGARGTFGVVLITTKNADKDKTSITYSGSFTSEKPVSTPDIVDDGYTYASMFYTAYNAWNNYSATPAKMNKTQAFSTSWLDDFKARKAAGNTKNYEVVNGQYVYYGNENYYKALYKKYTFSQDHNLSINGNTGKMDYYLSGRIYDYGGLFKYNTDTYKSYNLRAKEALQVTDWLKITNNMDYSNMTYHNPTNVGEGGSIWRNIADEGHPSSPIFNPDGSLTYSAAYTVGDFIYGKNGMDTNNRVFKNTTSFIASFLKNHMHVNGDFTYRTTDNNVTTKRVPVPYSTQEGVTTYLRNDLNDIKEDTQRYDYLATNLYTDYETDIAEKHHMKVMIGYNYEQQKYKSLSVQRNGLLTENVENINLALGQTITTSGEYSKWRTAGGFTRVNYSFADRYLFEFDGRYDGSSKFPSNQQWAFFPSASVGWRVSQEPFWHVNDNLLSNLKIRASFGSLGNGNVSPYSYMELLSINSGTRILNGTLNNYTSAPSVLPDNLTWEKATTANIGLDFSMLKNHLLFNGDFYVRKTKNMYTVGPTLPDVFGASSPKGNYADMTTRGFEISINYSNKFTLGGKPFNYEIKGTLSDYLSKIDKYNNLTGNLNDYYKGETLGTIWGYHIDGLFKDQADIDSHASQKLIKSSSNGTIYPGDLKYADLDNSNTIDYGTNTLSSHGDLKKIGNTTPRFSYSMNLSANWNNFFFSAFFQGIGHQDWYPSNECIFWGQYNRPYNNIPKWQLKNIYSESNPNAYLPRYAGYNASMKSTVNDRYLQNVAYLRLKNLQFGYNIPKQVLAKWKIQNLRLYVSGENLFCLSPLYKWTKDIDVANIYGSDNDLTSGTSGDGQNYPLMKSLSLGLSVTF